jgi:hypothetical protein
MKVSDFIGKVLTGVDIGTDEVRFVDSAGKTYRFYHYQDCCESVEVDSTCGDVLDLIGHTIVEAEETVLENETPEGLQPTAEFYDDSYTWTIHRFRTTKGTLEIRWLGQSNGYYGEDVDLEYER